MSCFTPTTTEPCSTCDTDFTLDNGSELPTVKCDPNCPVLLCPCCAQFQCGGCGQTFCMEHAIEEQQESKRIVRRIAPAFPQCCFGVGIAHDYSFAGPVEFLSGVGLIYVRFLLFHWASLPAIMLRVSQRSPTKEHFNVLAFWLLKGSVPKPC